MCDLLGKGSISAALPHESTVTFSDVSTENVNYNAITYISQAGILNGMSNGGFNPNDSFNPKYFKSGNIEIYGFAVGKRDLEIELRRDEE